MHWRTLILRVSQNNCNVNSRRTRKHLFQSEMEKTAMWNRLFTSAAKLWNAVLKKFSIFIITISLLAFKNSPEIFFITYWSNCFSSMCETTFLYYPFLLCFMLGFKIWSIFYILFDFMTYTIRKVSILWGT